MKFKVWSLVCAAAVCPSAQAIIQYVNSTTASKITTAPTGTFSNSGWQYEVPIQGIFLGTPIGPHAMLTAAHIIGLKENPNAKVSAFSWNGKSYTVQSNVIVPGSSDLMLVVTNESFDAFAPLYNPSVDGSLSGKTQVIFGRGKSPGTLVSVGGNPRGWQWGAEEWSPSWGSNNIDALLNYPGYSSGELTYSLFDPVAGESTVAYGDSGGGGFVKGAGDIWKFVSTMYGVEARFRTTPTATDFLAAVYNKDGLYEDTNGDGTFELQGAEPTYFIASNASNYYSYLSSYIPHPGDATLDGKVNTLDFNQLAGHFGESINASTPFLPWASGDFNRDGAINSTDFNLLMSNYGFSGTPPLGPTVSAGEGTSGTNVPEPASMLAIAAVSLTAVQRRR
jgi:hypothetical protein